jgi:alkylation response protein AidB-like acyl-CoA dehydrogenase
MRFGLSPPQELLQRSLRDLLARECPIARVREIAALDGDRRAAATAPLLAALADQGATGVLAPESAGGLAGTLLDAVVVAQELARAVAPISLHEAWTLGALLLPASEHISARDLLAGLCTGGAPFAVAVEGLRAEPGGGARIAGEAVVAAGPGVERVAVVEDGAGRRLVSLPAALEGVALEPLDSVDLGRPLWTLHCDPLAAGPVTVLADELAEETWRRALAAARIVLAADLVGAAQRALEIAVGYSLERRQFGRVVGSYQAVKHLCAERAAELEPLQAMVWHAAHAWDTGAPEAAWLAPLAKAHAADVAMETVTQATQVFGGMGFTWECDAHLYYQRVVQSRQLLGGPVELRAEAAAIRYR